MDELYEGMQVRVLKAGQYDRCMYGTGPSVQVQYGQLGILTMVLEDSGGYNVTIRDGVILNLERDDFEPLA
ncbi:MAG: hypothetical protein ACREQ5_27655 [Candidatus Dormibacteria bacterium]